ncbi:MAG TPA: AAA family ATPase [Novimethylophilus sp.]|jgi:putative DNA primase/helicase|uniref:AAA family ATPase n=1 Tax=Novimethylophilus sp. TaxID=2137426 RepID=UPI002F3EBA5A
MDIRPEALAAFDAGIDLEARALAMTGKLSQPIKNNQSGGDSGRQFAPLPVVQLTCAASIIPKPINWLWDGWLARGKLHIFAGQAGTGKTTIAIALAATVSIGGRFPDGSRCPVGNVLIWSGEDSAKDTLIPRLLAADADLSKVHFIGDVQHGDELRSFDPATDIAAMLDVAGRIGDVSLLIVDPIVNAVAGDSHKNGEVRRALQPLVDFGERLGCAVLGISHFSKGSGGREPLERVTGSLAFGALARIVLATAKIIEGETTRRIFCRAKSNIGVDHGGFEYDLHQKEIDGHPGIFSSYSVWGDAVEGSARELLAEPDNREAVDHDNSALEDAKEFLLDLLANGELSQKQIEADAKGASHSWRTVRRAKDDLGIKSVKGGLDGRWYWKLSGNMSKNSEDVQHGHINYMDALDTLPKIGHLSSDSVADDSQLPNQSHLRI